MKRIIVFAIALCAIISCCCFAFAEQDLFYYDRSSSIVEQAITDDENLKSMRACISYFLRENYFDENVEIDESKITWDTDKIVLSYEWKSTDFVSFFDTDDQKAYLKNIFENDPTWFYFPCYYDGERLPYLCSFLYNAEENKFEFYNELNALGEYRVIYRDQQELKEMLDQKLQQECQPVVLVQASDTLISITKLDGQYVGIYLPSNPQWTEVRYDKVQYDRMMQKNYYTMEELTELIAIHESELANQQTQEDMYGGETPTVNALHIVIFFSVVLLLAVCVAIIININKKRIARNIS